MLTTLEVLCIHCGKPMHKQVVSIGGYITTLTVNVCSFEQTSWECIECGHTTCIGDIDTIDLEDI